jgi:8-oxo-dGTP diphosphatase
VSFVIKEGDAIKDEWMMFTFFADAFEGEMVETSSEGSLAWHPFERLKELPMAEGDRHLLEYVLHGKGMIFGTFHYSPEFKLLSYRLDPS